jgi:hypothetical protein
MAQCALSAIAYRRGSSMAEQGTHKPLVGGSNPPLAIKGRWKLGQSSQAPAAEGACFASPRHRLIEAKAANCGRAALPIG